jgi:hypothetical protein
MLRVILLASLATLASSQIQNVIDTTKVNEVSVTNTLKNYTSESS